MDDAPNDSLEDISRRFDEQQRIEEEAWHPAESLERSAWNVVGCWQSLVAEVNFMYFHVAGPGARPSSETKLPATIRKVAEIYGVRWPHDEWSAAVDKVGKVRHKLAHLLYIYSITGEEPHRTMTIMRLGGPQGPRKGPDGHRGELSWRQVPDDKNPDLAAWSQMTMHLDTITEDELSEVLEEMLWMRDCCRILGWLGDVAAEMKPRPDLALQKGDPDFVPWWFAEWGDRGSTQLTWGDVMLPGYNEKF
ncbi:hypothetical protein IU451_15450 [Nocardia cyriacigeorgica]|uniref:hypothetical protein n=1 Tax=Nocardia cyriacigeorgica TaxID=135487 RepID=UPI001894ABE0|nr:hypothetical protein [Nocardia cyriacigeorgica]MBF6323914.1 hypothetical protein [Nocardia cyriacigeorgica]